ncbi:transcriptional regulator [Veillonella agrestimuris]|uniref:transcriptional regulator n=1 Tax=Veillonella agrestimuris TaxID=2941340 RepID=UPI00203B62B4|nr:transcriptional regulator [Veillonella agrestimuris]
MKRIIVTAILTVIFAVGTVTSFIANDLSNVTQWLQTNESQFKKPPKHDRHKENKDGKYNKDMRDGKHSPAGQPMAPNGPMNGAHQGQPMNSPHTPMNNPDGNMPQQGHAPADTPQNIPQAN